MTPIVGARAATTVIAAVLVAGCGGGQTPDVVSVYGAAGSSTLEVGVARCGDIPKVAVAETADEVRLNVVGDAADDRADCLTSVLITLDAPLGDRQVLDDATGKTVTVSAPENTAANP